jgi:hypothetical protein
MDASNTLNNMLKTDWLVSSLLPFISEFGGLRSFAACNKANLAAVRSLVSTWPKEIREFLKTWCSETSDPIVFAAARLRSEVTKKCVMIPPARFQACHLSYNSVANKLEGQPWSHVSLNGISQSEDLINNLNCGHCYANVERTKVFFCGGNIAKLSRQGDIGYLNSDSAGLLGCHFVKS